MWLFYIIKYTVHTAHASHYKCARRSCCFSFCLTEIWDMPMDTISPISDAASLFDVLVLVVVVSTIRNSRQRPITVTCRMQTSAKIEKRMVYSFICVSFFWLISRQSLISHSTLIAIWFVCILHFFLHLSSYSIILCEKSIDTWEAPCCWKYFYSPYWQIFCIRKQTNCCWCCRPEAMTIVWEIFTWSSRRLVTSPRHRP